MDLFSVYELMLLEQDPPDYSQFVNLQRRALAQTYLTATDVAQLLSLDPYIAGEAFGDHPERFKPGCTSPGMCPAPARISMNRVKETGSSDPSTIPFDAYASPTQAGAANVERSAATQDIGLLAQLGGDPVATLSVAYLDVTAASDFNQRSTSITLQNSSHCEQGTVDLWFDKAFGGFLWSTYLVMAADDPIHPTAGCGVFPAWPTGLRGSVPVFGSNRPVREAGPGSLGESIEDCCHLIVEKVASRRTMFLPPGRDFARLRLCRRRQDHLVALHLMRRERKSARNWAAGIPFSRGRLAL